MSEYDSGEETDDNEPHHPTTPPATPASPASPATPASPVSRSVRGQMALPTFGYSSPGRVDLPHLPTVGLTTPVQNTHPQRGPGSPDPRHLVRNNNNRIKKGAPRLKQNNRGPAFKNYRKHTIKKRWKGPKSIRFNKLPKRNPGDDGGPGGPGGGPGGSGGSGILTGGRRRKTRRRKTRRRKRRRKKTKTRRR